MKDKFQNGDEVYVPATVVKSGEDGTYQVQAGNAFLWKSTDQLFTQDTLFKEFGDASRKNGIKDAINFFTNVIIEENGNTGEENSFGKLSDMFGTSDIKKIILEEPEDNLVSNIKEWAEERDNIHVGDVVLDCYGYVGVVTCIEDEDEVIYKVLYPDGGQTDFGEGALTKTGDRVQEVGYLLSEIDRFQNTYGGVTK